jgi:hypothetical protein
MTCTRAQQGASRLQERAANPTAMSVCMVTSGTISVRSASLVANRTSSVKVARVMQWAQKLRRLRRRRRRFRRRHRRRAPEHPLPPPHHHPLPRQSVLRRRTFTPQCGHLNRTREAARCHTLATQSNTLSLSEMSTTSAASRSAMPCVDRCWKSSVRARPPATR